MANQHLTLNPRTLSPTEWVYEESHGLTVVSQLHDAAGNYVGTTVTKVPWRLIRGALERKDRPADFGERDE